MARSTVDTIARSARQLFYEKGFHGCSVDEIARHSGHSRTTVYLHFRNKDEILLHLLKDDLEYQMKQYQSLAEIVRPTIPALKAWLGSFRSVIDERRGSLSLFTASMTLAPELARHVDHHRILAIAILGSRFKGFDLDALDRQARNVQRARCYMVLFLIEGVTLTFSNAPSAPSLEIGIDLLAAILADFLQSSQLELAPGRTQRGRRAA